MIIRDFFEKEKEYRQWHELMLRSVCEVLSYRLDEIMDDECSFADYGDFVLAHISFLDGYRADKQVSYTSLEPVMERLKRNENG